MDPLQASEPDGGCRREVCRRAARARWLSAENSTEERRRAEGAARLREAGHDPGTDPWTVVPANDAGPVRLDPQAAAAFRTHLRRILDDLAGDLPSGPGAVDSRPPDDLDADEAAAVGRACATCRGWCCRRGGTHAFLDHRSLARAWAEGPEPSLDDLEAAYLAHLGDTHLAGGCVFQGPSGCRLPRRLRSDTCNGWLCPDLRRQRQQWRHHGVEPNRTRFVAVPPPNRLKKS